MFDALLELAVLECVDERVYAAVCFKQHDGEVVEPAAEVDGDATGDVADENQDLVWWPAYDESAANDQWYENGVASGRVDRRRRNGSRLKH